MYKELISRRGLSLDRLHNFCLIADAGGISKAADRDPARQSLYSRQVRELEEFFGVELTKRQGKRVVLTDAGKNLARLVREQLQALSDFQHECRDEPVLLRIAAGNSVLEWLVMPRLGAMHKALPNTIVDLVSLPTKEIVEHLKDMVVDLGILRVDAVPRSLKSRPLAMVDYALFVNRGQASKSESKDLQILVGGLRLATSKGGAFREKLEASAAKAGIPLQITLSCSSFTQAARAVRTGKYAGILPTTAATDLPSDRYAQIPLSFLKSYRRQLCLAWNPRAASVRPIVSRAADLLAEQV